MSKSGLQAKKPLQLRLSNTLIVCWWSTPHLINTIEVDVGCKHQSYCMSA